MSTPQPQQAPELFLNASDQQRVVEQFLTQQILAQGTTDKWSGQGKGSAQANAADMAKIMANSGITDINQFGKVTQYEPVEAIKTLYNGQQVFTETREDGEPVSYIYEPTGKILTGSYGDGGDYEYPETRLVTVPKDAKLETVYGVIRDGGESGGYLEPVDASKIKTVDGKLVGDTGQTTFGNKLTGQAIVNNYETGSNAFAGTYDGKGNTGYRVEFDAQGNPLFYTTGASSSDVPKWVKPALILGAAYFGLDAAGLLGGAASTAGATGLTLAELGGTAGAGALTAAESAALYGTAGTGLLSGGSLTAGITAADIAALEAGLPSGLGSLTAGITAADIAAAETGLPGLTGTQTTGLAAAGTAGTVAGMGTGTGITVGGAGGLGGATGAAGLGTGVGTGLTVAGAGGLGGATGAAGLGGSLGAGLTAGAGLAGTGVLTGSGLGTTLLGTGTGALTGTGVLTGSGLGTTLLGTGAGTGVTGALTTGVGAGTLGAGALTTGVGAGLGTAGAVLPAASNLLTDALTKAGTTTAINKITGGGTGTTNLSNLFSGGLTTAGSLLQQQASKEAALAAQKRIDAETAAAKQAAAFRPVGMTTRFGTSQFQTDPVTGQLTSAGYTLSPEAKAQQDRFVALSNQGLTQAEGAQAQYAPLQTGAQSLFNLGNQYISQTPQSVAQNYLNQQMALLQPGRELELANLQNKLQQQGRGGLSVAQGGTYGATTPELQALYNARAKQEAELAANAQQAGQKDVLFGAGLFDKGSTAMGNYYAGQKAAYDPYTTALTQIKDLETLGQKPFTMATDLAQLSSAAGARAGQLGLQGAGQSVALATGANATSNPYAQALMAAGNPNAMFGQSLNNAFSGLFGNSPVTAMSAPATSFGSGDYYGNQDLGLYL